MKRALQEGLNEEAAIIRGRRRRGSRWPKAWRGDAAAPKGPHGRLNGR